MDFADADFIDFAKATHIGLFCGSLRVSSDSQSIDQKVGDRRQMNGTSPLTPPSRNHSKNETEECITRVCTDL